MIKKEVKFAYARFNKIWIITLWGSFFGILIISIFSEIQEFFKFGYELGLFLMPVFSSFFVSILVYFFTSHLQDSIRVLKTFHRFDDFRASLAELLRFCHQESGQKVAMPTYKELNLLNFYSVEIKSSTFQKKVWIDQYDKHFTLAEWIQILIGSIDFARRSNSFQFIDEKYFDKLTTYELAVNALRNEEEHGFGWFLQNIVICLNSINNQIRDDKEYKLAFKLKFGYEWPDIELEEKITISF